MVGPIVELWDCLQAWRERKWKTHFGARSSEGRLGSGWNVGIVWITNCLCCRGHHFLLDIVLSELGWMVTLTQLRICSVHGICISAYGLRAEWPKHRLGLHSEMIQCILSYLKSHYLNLFHLSFFSKKILCLFMSFLLSLKFLLVANRFLSVLWLPCWRIWYYSAHCDMLNRRRLLQNACLRILLFIIWEFHIYNIFKSYPLSANNL